MNEIEVGFSSCPNDTFMFHGLLTGIAPVAGLRVVPVIEDIEALNARAAGPLFRTLPFSKLSAAAFARHTDRYAALSSGSALGRGCGPLVVGRRGQCPPSFDQLAGANVGIPGEGTTAWLLMRIFGPPVQACPMRFDAIMAAVASGRLEAGLVIHESRFTYAAHGLEVIADLGELWERDTGLPLPLGIIGARRDVDSATVAAFEAGLAASVRAAFAAPHASREFVRAHAQELDDEVCRRHIALYVNEFSIDVGAQGRAAIEALIMRGRRAGLLPPDGIEPFRRA